MKIIDFRLRPPVLGYLGLRALAREDILAKAERLCVPPSQAALDRSMTAFRGEMDDAGVSLGVMIGYQGGGPEGSVPNDDIATLQAQYPDRLIGFGSVRLGCADTLMEAERAVRELGLRGISVDPATGDRPMFASDPSVAEVAKKCEEMRVPLAVTVSSLDGPDFSYGDPLDVERLAAAFPGLPIIVCHACWPHVHGICAVAFKRRNVYVSPDMFMLNFPGVQDFVVAANSFLQDQFLFASAYPSAPLKPLTDLYASLPFRDSVREKVMFGNAKRLLGL